MEWTIEYWDELKTIYVKTRGILTTEVANEMVKDLVEAMSRHQCQKQIIDHSDTDMQLKVIEYYDRPSINEQIGLSRSWKIAMIYKDSNENAIFMETVFRNRGYNFRGFTSLEEAKEWIAQQ